MAQTRSTSASNRQASGLTSSAVIALGTRVRGRVMGDGDLTVEGRIEGEVHLRGALFIAEGGHVASNIDADGLQVAGALEGDVNVSGDVTILAGARVKGDVKGASISLEEGADLDGNIDCEFSLPRELADGAGR